MPTASTRDDGSLYPLPGSASHPQGNAKAIKALLTRSLTEQRETADGTSIHRTDGDLRYSLHITTAGLAAIGVEPGGQISADERAGEDGALAPSVPAPRGQTKASLVLSLLQREAGVTLPELIEATGWLPHSMRAALTGLRKKGHAIARSKRDDATCYRIEVEIDALVLQGPPKPLDDALASRLETALRQPVRLEDNKSDGS